MTLLEPKEPFALLLSEKLILPIPSEFQAGNLEVFSICIKAHLAAPSAHKNSKVPVLSFFFFLPKKKAIHESQAGLLGQHRNQADGEQKSDRKALLIPHPLFELLLVDQLQGQVKAKNNCEIKTLPRQLRPCPDL